MALKRLFQATMAAVVLTAAMPASAQQVLKVGSTPTGIPFTFLDTKTNSIQGIMVDLITEIGKDAGFAVQIEPMQFSALVPSLTSNKIDIISAAMFATAARKEVIDFSDAVYTYGEGLVVPKTDAKNYAKRTYVLNLLVQPAPEPPHVVSVSLPEGAALDGPPTTVRVQFDSAVNLDLQARHGWHRRDRNPQERQRVAGQDQRLARQAQGQRHHRQDSREMGTEGRRLLMS